MSHESRRCWHRPPLRGNRPSGSGVRCERTGRGPKPPGARQQGGDGGPHQSYLRRPSAPLARLHSWAETVPDRSNSHPPRVTRRAGRGSRSRPKPQARHREVSAGHNAPKPWSCAPPVADLLFLGASDASPHNVWGLGPRLWADTPVASGANQWLPSSVRLPGWSLVLQLLVFAPPLAGRTVHWHPSPSGC